MDWDSIERIITATCAVIVAACTVLSLIKKYPTDPTKRIRAVVVLVAVAAAALVSGIISGSMTTLSLTIIAGCSILLLIKISNYSIAQEGTVRKRDRVLVTVVLVIFAMGIMLLFLNKLPVILGKVVREECDIIALMAEAEICKYIQVGHEKVVTTLADSQAACKRVYLEALERTRAGKSAYVERLNERYFVPEDWKVNNEPVLLTAEEKSIIQDCFAAATPEDKKDLCVLICSVLNDERMIRELARPGAYDVQYYELYRLQGNTPIAVGEKTEVLGTRTIPIPVVSRKTVRHITPYEKIAIIGAYIDEKIREYARQ